MSKSIYVPTAGDIYIYMYICIYIYNNFSLERGPRGEWGPGSVRARKKLQFGALDARARTQDPFQRKLSYIYICMSPIYI